MPDMTPVATEIQPPSPTAGLDAYSRILGLKQQQLGLQTGQANLVQAQAQASLEARIARERQALAGVNWSQFQQPDGSFDEDAVTKTALAVAPTTGSQFAQQFNQMNEGSAETKKAWLGLNTDLQDQVRSTLGAWAADPNSTSVELTAQLENLEENAPPGMRGQITQITDHMTRALGMVPAQAQKQLALGLSRAGLGQSELSGPGGLGTPGTGTINTGSQIVPIAQNRVSGAVSQQPGTLDLSLSPSQQPSYLSTAAAASGVGASDQDRYTQVSQAATNAQTGITLAQQVEQLASEVRTGKLSKEWSDRLAVLSQHSPGITARQMLGKYAAQLQTMALSAAPTDSARAQIESGMPDPNSMDPDAVGQAAQYMGGLFSMNKARGAVADQFRSKHGGNVNGLRTIDDQFMSHADPLLFEYQNIPAGQPRQQWLKSHFKTAQQLLDFERRSNIVDHYGGYQ